MISIKLIWKYGRCGIIALTLHIYQTGICLSMRANWSACMLGFTREQLNSIHYIAWKKNILKQESKALIINRSKTTNLLVLHVRTDATNKQFR